MTTKKNIRYYLQVAVHARICGVASIMGVSLREFFAKVCVAVYGVVRVVIVSSSSSSSSSSSRINHHY